MATFIVRLADDVAARFDKLAASYGGRSKALRLVIGDACNQAKPLPEVQPSSGRYRVEIKLNEGDAKRLEAMADERGLTRTDWIVALIQTRLNGAPVPVVDQRQTLTDIRIQLRGIAKNVNQVVKAFHAANMEDSRLEVSREVARLAAMAESVSEQVEAIGDAMRGDLSYWRAGDE
ncbi:mobilization protein [Sphingomonas sp. PAMC 26621]|uniref:mobilization protein n=1 Tax=Sphingomonas sp. PAMC 26621 TaxID=1112213 RepID=UPI000288BA88|nr:mobilization protein [Sphingomonas sp. PAMC 26621]RYF20565.1 MAG: mobilization protein [Oxalobacteraceae bacterium]